MFPSAPGPTRVPSERFAESGGSEGDGGKRPRRRRLDEQASPINEVGGYGAARVNPPPRSVLIDETHRHTANAMPETSDRERQSAVGVLAQRVNGIDAASTHDDFYGYVHQIISFHGFTPRMK